MKKRGARSHIEKCRHLLVLSARSDWLKNLEQPANQYAQGNSRADLNLHYLSNTIGRVD